MILKVNKCFLSALYNAMQLKMCGFREGKGWRTVNLGNSEGMHMFLYYDHKLNRSIALHVAAGLISPSNSTGPGMEADGCSALSLQLGLEEALSMMMMMMTSYPFNVIPCTV